MKYCKKCVMPDTRPGITFDEEGVCQPCRSYGRRKDIDWGKRRKELEKICDKYRRKDSGKHDCLIAVSGGKDSHFQVHVMKELMGMNPLLVTVEDNFPMTKAGLHNIRNISEEFDCEIISLKPNIKAQKHIMRKTFERYGQPTWYIDRLIYTFPIHMAVKFSIPLLVYGENVTYEYGGEQQEETFSAKEQISNGVASDIPWEELIDDNIIINNLELCKYVSSQDINKIEPIYLSYFVQWNSYGNYGFAKSRGFKSLTHEWRRTHHIEDFDQVDSRAYLVHPWLKYPKFGHATATDYAAKFIRYGLITREKGIRLVKKHDHDLDPKVVNDFINFLGYSAKEFWAIVDKHYNRDLFKKDANGEWRLKDPIYKSLED